LALALQAKMHVRVRRESGERDVLRRVERVGGP
jgi:hypothetical protein